MKILWFTLVKTALIILITPAVLFAQRKDIALDSIRAKVANYGGADPASVLFAHFDKTIYNNTETAWFTAYLLNSNEQVIQPSALLVILVNEANRSVVAELKFAIHNGTAYGNIEIPDSVPSGNYSFILYTNILLNGRPKDVFTQHIGIKGLVTNNGVNISAAPKSLPVLSLPKGKPTLKFYPEGGNLVNATPGMVGLEARDANGAPVQIKAVLYKNNQFTDTIKTDHYGMGRFRLTPYLTSTYQVKIVADPTIYRLPKILPRGAVLHLTNAVVSDSLQLSMWDTHSGRYHVIIHNYRQVFYSYHAMLGAAVKSSTLSLKDLPKGVAVITVLDSLNHPIAERLFFAHYNRQANIGIGTDKQTYSPRQRVTLKLKLNNYNADSISAMVSVACVQASRLQPRNERMIANYFYLGRKLSNLPLMNAFSAQTKADKNLLENILLIKGWRRYNWQDMMGSSDSEQKYKLMGTAGFAGKTYLNPFSALVTLDGKMDVTAYFANQNKRVNSLLNESVFKTRDQSRSVNVFLTNRLVVRKDTTGIGAPPVPFLQPTPYIAKNMVLSTVNVRATKLYNYIANDCGDYVCRFNVLDCATHKYEKDNTTPKIKGLYTVDDSSLLANNQRVTIRQAFRDDKGKRIFIVSYNGCANLKTDLELVNQEGLTEQREFYSSDYKQLEAGKVDYLSTIYWKHVLRLGSKNETEVSFYTSDALGPFKIIVQGVTGKDVIYGEKTFTVAGP